jgi:glycosyltransferase involved in cell wall biosynthesis
MRVLHLIKTNVGATWALRQMRELVKLGVEVHATVPPGGPLNAEYEKAGVVLHPAQFDLTIRQPWRWPSLFRDFRRLVKEVGPHVIHSHFVGTTLTMRLALGKADRLPRIFQVPGPLHLEHRVFREGELATAGRSDYWIGACKYTCDIYRRFGVPPERLSLAYYGVDVHVFEGAQPGRLRSELNLDAEDRIVGMVAFMYPPKRYLGQRRGLKGHEDLIDAIAAASRRLPRIVGVFVGSAWNHADRYERSVRRHASRCSGGRTIFLGTRGDVPALYKDFDVAVHPSHSENLGGAGESMLSGVPTVATNVGGFPDLIEHGRTGWLVPPRRPLALAECIQSVLRNRSLALEVASRGQERARVLLDVRRTAAEVAAIYERVQSRAA